MARLEAGRGCGGGRWAGAEKEPLGLRDAGGIGEVRQAVAYCRDPFDWRQWMTFISLRAADLRASRWRYKARHRTRPPSRFHSDPSTL